MSQKHTLNSVALVAVFALAIFAVALGLFLFVGKFAILGSIFMAFVIALLAAVVLFIGFGDPSAPAMPAARAPALTPEAPAAPETPEAGEDAAAEAEAAARAAEEQAARERAEAAAEAEAARKAAEEAAATAATAAGPLPEAASEDEPSEETTGEAARPAGLDAPRNGKADDLKQIKGIGPKMEQVCNRLGYWHFDQIAAWTPDEVAWVDANLEGFPGRVTRDNWVEQAKVLAGGGETEFSKRVEDGDVY